MNKNISQATRLHRINLEIRARQVRLLDVDGSQKGICSLKEALFAAEQIQVDLVEINPSADPPVCRLMDYGKYLYEKHKEAREQKKKQKSAHLKEIKLRPCTEMNDYQIKLRNLVRFIEEGDKVKVTLRFRGRELAHQENGFRIFDRIREDTAAIATVESFPRSVEGKQIVMLLAPKKKN